MRHRGNSITMNICFALIFALVSVSSAAALEKKSWDITTLVKSLQSSDISVRRNASVDLAALGPEAESAVAALSKALDDKDGLVRRNAASALGAIGPKAQTAIPSLVEALEDKDVFVRQAVVSALALIGPDAAPAKADAAIPALVGALDDPDAFVRWLAVDALNRKGWNNNKVITAMSAILEDKNADSRTLNMIISMIKEQGFAGQNKAIIASLIRFLNDDNPFLRLSAIEAIDRGMRGNDAYIDAMTSVLEDKNANPRTQRLVISLIGEGRLKAKDSVSLFIDLLQSPDAWIRVFAAKALGNNSEGANAAIPALIYALDDNCLAVRYSAADALVSFWPESVDALRGALQNRDPYVRALVTETLGRFRSEAAAAAGPDLALLLATDVSPAVRGNAARSIGSIGENAGDVAPALVKALKDDSGFVRGNAALALGMVKSGEVEALKEVLRDNEPFVRRNAAKALALIRRAAKPAESELVEALKDADENVRKHARDALEGIGPLSESSIASLVDELSNPAASVRQEAIEMFAILGSKARLAIPELSRLLKQDEAPIVRQASAKALGRIGTASNTAIEALVDALKDPWPDVRREAAMAMGLLKPVSDELVIGLKDRLVAEDEQMEVRIAAAKSLGRIGLPAKPAVPELIAGLGQKDPQLLQSSIEALGNIGPDAGEAVPNLITLLKSSEDSSVSSYSVRIALTNIGLPAVAQLRELLRSGRARQQQIAAATLGDIGAKARDAVDGLIALIKDSPETTVRNVAVKALGKMGVAGQEAVLALKDVLEDKAPRELRYNAAFALGNIATALRDAGKISKKKELEAALLVMRKYKDDRPLEEQANRVLRAVQYMDLVSWKNWKDETIGWIRARPVLGIGVPLYLLWFIFWLVMLWVRPLALLRINWLLQPLEVKLPDRLGGVRFPLRFILAVAFLNYHSRVLNAWVMKQMPTVQERFNNKGTVRHRKVHISIPVKIDAKGIPDLKPAHLQPTFDRRVGCLLIWGEGGSGKTSLAFQVARWAMHPEGDERLGGHPMIPVLIEHELDGEAGNGSSPLMDAVAQQLQDMADQPKPIPSELLEQLLRYRRVLVIIDHLSEMSEHTRNCVRKELNSFPGNALMITSRLREKLDGRTRTVARPMRIAGNRLSSFMEAYLNHREKRELFSDIEFFDACRKLSLMVGDRNITVLLSKLYAEQMISAKKGVPAVDLPDTIPALILRYLNELNRAVTEDPLYDRIVHHTAMVVAWECLRKTFRPGTATYEDILTALGGTDAETHLKYLQDRLHLLEPVPPALDRVRLILDPLAEYMAAAHVVELNAGNEDAWYNFFAEADDKTGAPQTISGFLLAIRDCCLARKEELKIPDFVVPQLSKRTGPEAMDNADRSRRQEIRNLKAHTQLALNPDGSL